MTTVEPENVRVSVVANDADVPVEHAVPLTEHDRVDVESGEAWVELSGVDDGLCGPLVDIGQADHEC